MQQAISSHIWDAVSKKITYFVRVFFLHIYCNPVNKISCKTYWKKTVATYIGNFRYICRAKKQLQIVSEIFHIYIYQTKSTLNKTKKNSYKMCTHHMSYIENLDVTSGDFDIILIQKTLWAALYTPADNCQNLPAKAPD